NDPAAHGSGDFVYAPADPPQVVNGKVIAVAQSSLPDSDEFSEVHAFWHINQLFDFARGLSHAAAPIFPNENIQPFQMRDEKRNPPRKPAIWSNVTLPDYNEAAANLFGGMGKAYTNN